MNGSTPSRPQQIARLRNFGIVLACGAIAYIGYDELMWGTILDIGHTLYYHADGYGSPTGSPFQLSYLPYQIYSFFLRAPVLVRNIDLAGELSMLTHWLTAADAEAEAHA